MDEIQDVPVLPMYFHAWGDEPKTIIRNKVVKFKSMSVFFPSQENKPDVKSLCFPITGTTLIGCCLCAKEMQTGHSLRGFKSHCFRAHPWLCNYDDLQHHNTSLINVLETAYQEVLTDTEDAAAGKKRTLTAFFSSPAESKDKIDSFRKAIVKCVCRNYDSNT